MTHPQRDRRAPERAPVGSSPGPAIALPLFAVVLGTALAAGAVGHFLAGNAGLAGAAVVALFGAVIAAVAGGRKPEANANAGAGARAIRTTIEPNSNRNDTRRQPPCTRWRKHGARSTPPFR